MGDLMEMEALVSWFSQIAANPAKSMERWKTSTGRPVIGCLMCMPPYVPEEIIDASGALPAAIWGTGIPIRQSDTLQQSFTCSIARSALELGMAGGLDLCDGIVVPSTCDAFQNLSEIWRTAMPGRFHHDVVFPTFHDRASALPYLTGELKKLARALESVTGSAIHGDALRSGIRRVSAVRSLFRKLYDARRANPGALSTRALYEIVMASSMADRGEVSERLAKLVHFLEEQAEEGPSTGLSVMLAGVGPRPWGILDILEDLGVSVVDDDLGLGRMYTAPVIDDAGADPIDTLARALLDCSPVSTIHDGRKDRAEHIAERAKASGARAVILNILKFCEPEFFEYPDLKRSLAEAGIPLLMLETELQTHSIEGLRTRLGAFVETLGGGA